MSRTIKKTSYPYQKYAFKRLRIDLRKEKLEECTGITKAHLRQAVKPIYPCKHVHDKPITTESTS